MFSPADAVIINLPFVVVLSLHLFAILPDLLCRFSKKVEVLTVACMISEFIMEIAREH